MSALCKSCGAPVAVITRAERALCHVEAAEALALWNRTSTVERTVNVELSRRFARVTHRIEQCLAGDRGLCVSCAEKLS